jgi:hypothetical protein
MARLTAEKLGTPPPRPPVQQAGDTITVETARRTSPGEP